MYSNTYPYTLGCWAIYQSMFNLPGATPLRKTNSYSPSCYQLWTVPQLGVGLDAPTILHGGIWSGLSLTYAITTTLNLYLQLFWCIQNILAHLLSFNISWSSSFHHLFFIYTWVVRIVVWLVYPCRTEHSEVYYLHSHLLLASALIAISRRIFSGEVWGMHYSYLSFQICFQNRHSYGDIFLLKTCNASLFCKNQTKWCG